MAQLTDTTIHSALARGVAGLYIVAGDDAYLVDSCVSAIAEAAGAPPERYDALGAPREEMEQLFYNVPLLGGRRVVALDNLFAKSLADGDFGFYSAALGDLDSSLTVIARFVDTESRYFALPKRAQELQSATGCDIVKAMAKSGASAAALVEQLAEQNGVRCECAVASRIAELCGGDMMLASNELKKLAALADYGEITAAHVQALCAATAEAGVYDMLGQLERGNRGAALGLLNDMLLARTEPMIISSVLYTAFINIYRAKLAQQAQKGEAELFERFGYRKGDKKVGVAFRQARRYSVGQLERVIALLLKLDLALKSSPVDKGTLVELCAAQIMEELGE